MESERAGHKQVTNHYVPETDAPSKKRGWGPSRPEQRQPKSGGDAFLHSRSVADYMRLRRALKYSRRSHEDPYGQVINLSTKQFSKPEFKLLGYNLNSIPAPVKIDRKEL